MDLNKLKDFFNPSEIEFRIGATNQDKTKAIALPYITQRAVQNRLDAVCGPENWRNEFCLWKDKGQLCGISILINEKWITKWDGADDTKTESTKGGLSDAMKRAAVQWGIGRYLYDIPPIWVEIVSKGKKPNGEPRYVFKYQPCLPKEFIPAGVENKGYQADVITDEDKKLAEIMPDGRQPVTKEQINTLSSLIVEYGLSIEKIKSYYKLKELENMAQFQYEDYIQLLSTNILNFQMPKKQNRVSVSDNEKAELDKINSMLGAKV